MTTVQRSIKPGKASKPTARAASPKNAVSWILLADALALMADFYQDWWLAQGTLCKAFVELEVRNRAARALAGWICEPGQGQGKEYEHNLQLSDLWRREYFAPNWRPYSKLQIHWQDSSATLETDVCTDARSVTVRFYRIEVAREDLLKLLPPGYEPALPSPLNLASSVPRSGLKRGPKGFNPSQLKPFEIKFYEMLDNNKVSADANIAIDDYASDLIDWGERNDQPTPQRVKMSEEIKKWLLHWRDVRALKK